jgi:hypothetical protein
MAASQQQLVGLLDHNPLLLLKCQSALVLESKSLELVFAVLAHRALLAVHKIPDSAEYKGRGGYLRNAK